jgi:hypothetical protein
MTNTTYQIAICWDDNTVDAYGWFLRDAKGEPMGITLDVGGHETSDELLCTALRDELPSLEHLDDDEILIVRY